VTGKRRDLPVITAFYFVYFAGTSVMALFLPVFFSENIGVTDAQLGLMMAAGPAVTMASQPLWGLRADRARYKNTVLLILLAGTVSASLLIPLYAAFWYAMAAFVVMASFQTSCTPVADAIAVELCQERAWDYGKIRTAGSVGYSSMGWLAGIIIGGDNMRLFPLFAGTTLLTIIITVFLPRVKGHQRQKIKMPYIKLLQNPRLLTVLLMAFVANLTLGMHYTFFGIYFRELGGTMGMLGLAAFCASMLELPFTLNARRIIRRLGGPEKTLLISLSVMAARWLLVSLASTPLQLLLINCLHGFSFVVTAITMTLYIGEHVPPEMKASGQTLHGMLSSGAARIIGSVGGGLLISLWGKPGMFLTAAAVNALALAVFIPLILRRKQKEAPSCP
jgi:PPP family 3-phenylpropionic acid transporter